VDRWRCGLTHSPSASLGPGTVARQVDRSRSSSPSAQERAIRDEPSLQPVDRQLVHAAARLQRERGRGAGRLAHREAGAGHARGYNQLPYRMLLPRRATADGADNLLVAGRCASMTHDGHSAARVSGACFAMGQAAGTAAALALQAGCSVHELPVDRLQRRLVADGAFLG